MFHKIHANVSCGGHVVRKTVNLQNSSSDVFAASVVLRAPRVPSPRVGRVRFSRILGQRSDIVRLYDGLGHECYDSLWSRNLVFDEHCKSVFRR